MLDHPTVSPEQSQRYGTRKPRCRGPAGAVCAAETAGARFQADRPFGVVLDGRDHCRSGAICELCRPPDALVMGRLLLTRWGSWPTRPWDAGALRVARAGPEHRQPWARRWAAPWRLCCRAAVDPSETAEAAVAALPVFPIRLRHRSRPPAWRCFDCSSVKGRIEVATAGQRAAFRSAWRPPVCLAYCNTIVYRCLWESRSRRHDGATAV